MLLSRGTELVEASALGAKDIAVQSRHAAAGRLVLAGVMTATQRRAARCACAAATAPSRTASSASTPARTRRASPACSGRG